MKISAYSYSNGWEKVDQIVEHVNFDNILMRNNN